MSERLNVEVEEIAPTPLLVAAPMTPLRAMKITASILLVLGLTWVLWELRSILLLMVLGVLFAAAVEPIANWIRRRGLSRTQSILTVYAALLGLLIGGILLVAPPLVAQGQQLAEGIPGYLDSFRQQAASLDNPMLRRAAVRGVDRVEAFNTRLRTDPAIAMDQVGQAVTFVTSIFGGLFTIATVMIVAFYWMTEKSLIKRLGLGLFPLERRERAHTVWDDIEDKLGGWARGQLILMLIIGVVSTVFYGAIGLPFWFLLGIWAGLTELIPFVGPFLGGGLAVLVALTESWQRAVLVLIFVVVLQQLEGSVVVPRVMRNAVGLTPLTVILALLAGGTLIGVTGAVLAIPVAAAVQVILSEVFRTREEPAESEGQVILVAGDDGTISAAPSVAAVIPDPPVVQTT